VKATELKIKSGRPSPKKHMGGSKNVHNKKKGPSNSVYKKENQPTKFSNL